MLRTLTVMLSLLLAPPVFAQRGCGPLPGVLEGEAYAIDGDHLAIIKAGRRLPDIDLWGIQTPELRDRVSGIENRAGMQSRAALDDLLSVHNNRTTCKPVKWGPYCNIVAECAPTDGEEGTFNGFMLLGGWAYVYTTFALVPPGTKIAEMIGFERQARRARRGLWREWLPAPD